ADLAELRPGVRNFLDIGAFDYNRKSALAVRRHIGGARLVRRQFRNQLECRSQIESDLSMLAAVEAFVLRPEVETESPGPVNDLDQDVSDDERVNHGDERRHQL